MKAKKTRLERLNKLSPPRLPKGVKVAAWEAQLAIKSRHEAEQDATGAIFKRRYKRIFSNTCPVVNWEQLLRAYEVRAHAIFVKQENILDVYPEGVEPHIVLNDDGSFIGLCRTKYGDCARDLLCRIAEYRRLAKKYPRNHQRYRLFEIGRLAAIIELIEHEENASLGAERRSKINSKGGNSRKDAYSELIERENLEKKVNELIQKKLSPTRARQIVVNRLSLDRTRPLDALTITAETLRRRGIGRPRK